MRDRGKEREREMDGWMDGWMERERERAREKETVTDREREKRISSFEEGLMYLAAQRRKTCRCVNVVVVGSSAALFEVLLVKLCTSMASKSHHRRASSRTREELHPLEHLRR